MNTKDALKKAIKLAGGQAALGRKVAVSQPTVWYWVNEMGHPSAEYVAPIVAAVDGAVQPYELRPDIFPPPDKMHNVG